jgi:hypothetical protein
VAIEHHKAAIAAQRGQPAEQDRAVATDEKWPAATVMRLMHPDMSRVHQAFEGRVVEDPGRPALSARGQEFEVSRIGHSERIEAVCEAQAPQDLDRIGDTTRLPSRGVRNSGQLPAHGTT